MKHFVKNILIVTGVLYAATWIGGWWRHSHDLAAWAQMRYEAQAKRNDEQKRIAQANGDDPFLIELRESGPRTSVNWCVPLVPGLILADSEYVIGPMNAKGSLKLVFFYGFGSVVVSERTVWIT